MKAPQAAGVIHSDFERGFICAEVRTMGREGAGEEGEVTLVGCDAVGLTPALRPRGPYVRRAGIMKPSLRVPGRHL